MKNKILVIEDNDDILFSLQTILEFEDYAVKGINDGDIAYKTVKSFSPDLILLDALLSGSNGWDIANEIKNDDSLKHIPIVMMSAHPKAEELAKEYQINDFLAKPFKMDDLLNKIKHNLEAAPKLTTVQ
jgi:DNA-binding response OmpR family regulator